MDINNFANHWTEINYTSISYTSKEGVNTRKNIRFARIILAN